MKILLDDLQNNRHRIQEIFQRIDDVEENEEDIWTFLVREGLISDEEFEKLSQLENTELKEISSIVKGVKSGQGISFLPTTMAVYAIHLDNYGKRVMPRIKYYLYYKNFSVVVV